MARKVAETLRKSFATLRLGVKTNFVMHENEISKKIVHACFNIHTKLGPGLFESVYEEILAYELTKIGLNFQRQKGIPVIWDEVILEHGFRADIVVENKVIIEIKSVESIAPVHQKTVADLFEVDGFKTWPAN